ncbi:MAG: PAS domain-containing protein, partial [Bacillota bacterium]
KENKILFPMCLETLTEVEWDEIYRHSDEVGYTLITPERQWQPKILHPMPAAQRVESGAIPLDTGAMTPEQINLMLMSLTIDMTYVDEHNRVRYYSQGRERIFTRTPAIIGRNVEMCHPPESVHVVKQIVEDFKAGKRDSAEFWLTLQGKFIHIRYFAVRDDAGTYRGVVEVSQDVTGIRALEGQKRLLDEPAQGSPEPTARRSQ